MKLPGERGQGWAVEAGGQQLSKFFSLRNKLCALQGRHLEMAASALRSPMAQAPGGGGDTWSLGLPWAVVLDKAPKGIIEQRDRREAPGLGAVGGEAGQAKELSLGGNRGPCKGLSTEERAGSLARPDIPERSDPQDNWVWTPARPSAVPRKATRWLLPAGNKPPC